jgi:hypothetical protein
MYSVEAAERWLAHLRDHELSLFFSLLSKNDKQAAA